MPRSSRDPVQVNRPPRVSVILPVYNHGALLGRAIASVLAQTAEAWELVIVNDGSTDDSREVASRHVARFPRLTLLDLKHGGLPAAVNSAFEVTRGAYITTLDADDYYEPDHLEDNLRYLGAHPEADLVMSHARVLGDPYVIDMERPGELIHLDRCVIGGTFFVRRSVFQAVGGMPAVEHGMDYHFAQAVEAAGYAIHRRETRTYVYDRTRGGSITKNAVLRMRSPMAPT